MSHPSPVEPLPDSPAADPLLTSFVVRFVQTEANPADWHGLIRHIQSNTERAFTRWEDAQAFMGQYINLHPAHPDKMTG